MVPFWLWHFRGVFFFGTTHTYTLTHTFVTTLNKNKVLMLPLQWEVDLFCGWGWIESSRQHPGHYFVTKAIISTLLKLISFALAARLFLFRVPSLFNSSNSTHLSSLSSFFLFSSLLPVSSYSFLYFVAVVFPSFSPLLFPLFQHLEKTRPDLAWWHDQLHVCYWKKTSSRIINDHGIGRLWWDTVACCVYSYSACLYVQPVGHVDTFMRMCLVVGLYYCVCVLLLVQFVSV